MRELHPVQVPIPTVTRYGDEWMTPEVLAHVRLEILCRLRRKRYAVTSLEAEIKTSGQGNLYLELSVSPAAPAEAVWQDARQVLNDQADWLERGSLPG